MPKNILLNDFSQWHTSDVHKYLDDEIDIKVWIGRKKNKVTTLAREDFYRSLLFKKNRLKINYRYREEFLEIYPAIRKHMDTFLNMYCRRPVLYGANDYIDMMDAFHVYIHFYIDLLKSNDIHYVFFEVVPHHADYLLYLVAKALGVKTYVFLPAPVHGKSLVMDDIENIGSLDVGKTEIDPVKLERNYRKKYHYLNKPIKTNLFVKLISAAFFRHNLNLFLHRLQALARNARFKKNYRQFLAQHPPSENFVYFALHLQPELSTTSLGGIFVDQALALECLRLLLPYDWPIVVKEHPYQTFHSRGRLFYSRLAKIPNLHYVSKETDTYDLIERCRFVSTITGSVGLDALSFGKRVLIFGNAPYKNFPGVVSYRRDLTLEDIMAINFSHEEFEQAYAHLLHNAVDVITNVDYRYKELVRNISGEENGRALANVINAIVHTGRHTGLVRDRSPAARVGSPNVSPDQPNRDNPEDDARSAGLTCK